MQFILFLWFLLRKKRNILNDFTPEFQTIINEFFSLKLYPIRFYLWVMFTRINESLWRFTRRLMQFMAHIYLIFALWAEIEDIFFHDCSFVFLIVSLSMQKNYSKIIDSPSKTASIRLTNVRRMAQRIAKFFILTKWKGINLFYFYLCLSFSLIHKKYFREKEKSQSNFIKNKNK